MSAADFVHHDDMRPLEPTAWMPTAPRIQPVRHPTPDLPHVTSEELRASREELLAALNAARAETFEAFAIADDLFDRLKGRHRTTTPTKETK